MQQVLIVDNSKWLISVAARRISAELGLAVQLAQSYSDAVRLIEHNKSEFLVALVGLYLRDAPDGAIVDVVLSKNIPTVVFTGKFNENVRENILSKNVIDYVLKETPNSLDYVISLIRRIQRNQMINVLVAEDSFVVRRQICELLKNHKYNVLAASDGEQADRMLDQYPDVKIVITDYDMPNMNGFELTKRIRRRFSKDELAIIGMSGQNCDNLSVQFIKNGANDFMSKPFLDEEFYCRVSQNIEMIEYIREIKEISNKDYLTKLYNRRYLFKSGVKRYEKSGRKSACSVAMIDIDNFREINDQYGHDAGDSVLRKISMIMQKRFRNGDIVSRFGGDEFCILLEDTVSNRSLVVFEGLRKKIEEAEINIGYREICVTVSIGVCAKPLGSLEMMIKQADIMLYEAKAAGGNTMMCLSDEDVMAWQRGNTS